MEEGAFTYRHEHDVGRLERVLCREEDAAVVDPSEVVTRGGASQGKVPFKKIFLGNGGEEGGGRGREGEGRREGGKERRHVEQS